MLHTQRERQVLWHLNDFFEVEGREKQNEQTKSDLMLQRSFSKPQSRRNAGHIDPAQDHLACTVEKGLTLVKFKSNLSFWSQKLCSGMSQCKGSGSMSFGFINPGGPRTHTTPKGRCSRGDHVNL